MSKNIYEKASRAFSALGNEYRVALVLGIEGKMCLSDMADITGLTVQLTQYHVKVLIQAGLINAEKVVRRNYLYSLNNGTMKALHNANKIFNLNYTQ